MDANGRTGVEGESDRLLYIDKPEFQDLMDAARSATKRRDDPRALRLLLRVTDISEAYPDWQAAAVLADRITRTMKQPLCRRTLTVWIANSYTVAQFTPLLRLAALRNDIALDVHEGTYGQFQQEILDPESALYLNKPECVLLAVHAGDVALPEFSDDPDLQVSREAERWRSLCSTIVSRCGARVVMHNFAIPDVSPFGHLTRQLPGSRFSMVSRLNDMLAREATEAVSMVDCERLSSSIGKRRWFDARYWHLSRQACAFSALPLLARHTSAVLSASIGLAKKCIVLDLDNTLWGGVIGEDGIDGIRIGSSDPEGEAYQEFQSYLKGLKQRGILLAICSKNNLNDAREPFQSRPEMILTLDDFASFQANWDIKPKALQAISRELNIGLDSIVFVDDNPFERETVRRLLPDVETIALPRDPSGYQAALAMLPLFETVKLTREDGDRTALYRMRSHGLEIAKQADSMEDFLRGLDMRAQIANVKEKSLPRVVQLIAKTNQFNLTTKRYHILDVNRLLQDESYGMFTLSLRDRFGDHGLISVLGYRHIDNVLDVDLWLMSCRVIGRSVEEVMMDHLVQVAQASSVSMIRGKYIRTPKNSLVEELYIRLGFAGEYNLADDVKVYHLDVGRWSLPNALIAVELKEVVS